MKNAYCIPPRRGRTKPCIGKRAIAPLIGPANDGLHGSQNMFSIFARLGFVEHPYHLPHHDLRRIIVIKLLRNRNQANTMFGELTNMQFKRDHISKELLLRIA